jgi:hypothetical protein
VCIFSVSKQGIKSEVPKSDLTVLKELQCLLESKGVQEKFFFFLGGGGFLGCFSYSQGAL